MTYDKWKTTEPERHEEYFPPDEITDEREELYAEIERLRASNAALLAVAREALDAWDDKSGMVYSMTRAASSLRTAIAEAEKPEGPFK